MTIHLAILPDHCVIASIILAMLSANQRTTSIHLNTLSINIEIIEGIIVPNVVHL